MTTLHLLQSTNKNKKKSKKAGGPAEEETAAKKEAESEDTVEDEKEAGAKKELPLEKSYMSVILGEWQPYIIFAIVFFQVLPRCHSRCDLRF